MSPHRVKASKDQCATVPPHRYLTLLGPSTRRGVGDRDALERQGQKEWWTPRAACCGLGPMALKPSPAWAGGLARGGRGNCILPHHIWYAVCRLPAVGGCPAGGWRFRQQKGHLSDNLLRQGGRKRRPDGFPPVAYSLFIGCLPSLRKRDNKNGSLGKIQPSSHLHIGHTICPWCLYLPKYKCDKVCRAAKITPHCTLCETNFWGIFLHTYR